MEIKVKFVFECGALKVSNFLNGILFILLVSPKWNEKPNKFLLPNHKIASLNTKTRLTKIVFKVPENAQARILCILCFCLLLFKLKIKLQLHNKQRVVVLTRFIYNF